MIRFLGGGALLALISLTALFFALRVPQTYAAWRTKNDKIRVLQRQNADMRKENTDLKRWIEDLKSNRATQERVLRDQYHKQRQGDMTFQLPQPAAPAPPAK